MTQKPGPTNSRRRPVPDLERLGQAIADTRDDLVALRNKLERLRADLDAALLAGADSSAAHKAMREILQQEAAANRRIDELSAKAAALDATRLDDFVAGLTQRAAADTQHLLAAHSSRLNLDQFQPLGKQK